MRFILVISFIFVGTISWVFSKTENQYNTFSQIKYQPRYLALGSPSFSHPLQYNTYDLSGLALGLLERETATFQLATGYLSHGTSGEHGNLSATDLYLPTLKYNLPGQVSTQFYYRKIGEQAPKIDSVNGNWELQKENPNELGFHNLGLDLAFGSASKIFQMSIGINGTYGKVQDTTSSVFYTGSINFLDLGFSIQPTSLLRFGGHFGSSAQLDSLKKKSAPVVNIRSGQLGFPKFGFFTDFGDTSRLPLQFNLSLDFFSHREIGIYKENSQAGAVEWNQNPLWTSGYDWRSQFQYFLKNNSLTYGPALKFGIERTHSTRYQADIKNRDNPFEKGDKCIDGIPCPWNSSKDKDSVYTPGTNPSAQTDGTIHDWKNLNINVGLGSFMAYENLVTSFIEFEFNSASISTENNSKGYTGFLLGVEGNLHNIPQWHFPEGIELFARMSLVKKENNSNFSDYRPYHFQFSNHLSTGGQSFENAKSQIPTMGSREKWFAFNLGLGGTLLEGRLGGDFYLSLVHFQEIFHGSTRENLTSTGTETGGMVYLQF